MNEVESAPAVTLPRTRSRWWKRLALGASVLLLLAAGSVALFLSWTESALREAVAEADRLDPGWRWDELEAKRATVADADNSAFGVLRAHRLLPSPWPDWQANPTTADLDVDRGLGELTPAAPLAPEQASALAGALAAAQPALAEARRLKELPHGRYPVLWDPAGLRFSVPHVQAAQAVVRLLTYDELLREQAGDIDRALESCRGLLNVARSFGDEPEVLAQRTRLEMRGAACRRLERTLARGEPSETGLAALQRLLEDEEAQPLFLHGARGLRCDLDGLLSPARPDLAQQPGVRLRVTAAAYGRPATLRLTTRLVEIAKLPVEDQEEELRRQGLLGAEDAPLRAATSFANRIQKATAALSGGQLRSQAELRCAVVAVAAERYRRARGGWPPSLEDLVPEYLHGVPLDPFGKKPLRYRRLADGVRIDCTGPAAEDGPDSPEDDVGLRLWDPAHRRTRGRGP
jgi:hypothetical protein